MTNQESELLKKIETESKYTDIRPYSHNLVGMYLQILEETYKYTPQQISNVVTIFDLDSKGWGYLVIHLNEN